jgi:hypothetical protein
MAGVVPRKAVNHPGTRELTRRRSGLFDKLRPAVQCGSVIRRAAFTEGDSMSRQCERAAWFGVILMAALAVSGCSSSTRVPKDARLIWSGEVHGPGHLWKDIQPMQSGQVYVVDHQSGRVEGVESVWSGKPNFTFSLRPHRKYDLYFAQQVEPASRPAE